MMPLENLQNGRYRSVRQLGSGSMGEVYLVDDTVIGRKVAIKIMRADPATYPDTEAVKDAVKLFKREAQAIARMEHPNILPLYDFGEEKQNHTVFMYMVMPHCQEGSLATWLQQHRPKGPLPPDEVAYFVEQAAEALQYAHDHNVIHQDVKPSNFLLRTHADGQRLPDLLLADFGIARTSTGTTVSTTSAGPRGTPRYMPPEQWEGKPVAASDQYALAVMAYQLLTYAFPFKGEQMLQLMYQHLQAVPEPPSWLNPHLPRALDAVILRALAKKPEERFPSVKAFALAFRQAMQGTQPAQSVQAPRQQPSGEPLSMSYNTSMPTLSAPGFPAAPGQLPLILPERSAFPAPAMPTQADQYTGTPIRLPAHATPIPPTHFQQPVSLAASTPIPSPPSWAPPLGSNRPQLPPVQSPRRSSLGKVLLVISLVLLVVLAGTGSAYYVINAKRQIAITPTPNPDNNSYIASMPALRFADPLSAPYMWQSVPNDSLTNGYCLFEQGAYHVSSNVPTTFTLCPPAAQQPAAGDMTFETRMQILHGDCGGIFFRGDFQQGNFYYFVLCFDGGHYLFTYAHFKLLQNIHVQSTKFAALQANPQALVAVALVAQGNSFTFYVNHQQIDQISDSTYTSGQIALFGFSIHNPTEVVFSNARLWTP